jgi:hypothetical protein
MNVVAVSGERAQLLARGRHARLLHHRPVAVRVVPGVDVMNELCLNKIFYTPKLLRYIGEKIPLAKKCLNLDFKISPEF